MEAGRDVAIAPYGTEALSMMRIEKGHVAGSELNGTTTAEDLGLGRMMSTKKDYIGRMMAGREALLQPDRERFIGLKPVDTAQRLRAGAHLFTEGSEASTETDQGYVTAVAFSPMLDHWIGLGLIKRGLERQGEVVRVYDPLRGEDYRAEVVHPCFFDPDGGRMHA
jgi:sarcosine oxidase subunit alpha